MDRNFYKLYPNIYVMLHADSGLKKGPPVAMAKNIVKRVNNTRIISGRSSIQGILKELGTAQTTPGGRVNAKSQAFIVASEFSSSLVNDPAAMTILTDLYDRNYNEGEYRSLLKMESFQLKDPTLTMLVATNEAHFEDFVAKKDIQGGFIGRMFVIAESQVQRLNSLAAPFKDKPDYDKLSLYPKELSNISGEFKSFGSLEEDAYYKHRVVDIETEEVAYLSDVGKVYDDWYMNFYEDMKKSEMKDDTGTIQRIGDSIVKIAMILSLATDTSLTITETQMDEAIVVGEKLIGNIRRTTMSRKRNDDQAYIKASIINELLRRETHEISRAMLANKQIMGINVDELDKIMLSFHEAGIIETYNIGTQIIFKMPEKQVEFYKRRLEGKSK